VLPRPCRWPSSRPSRLHHCFLLTADRHRQQSSEDLLSERWLTHRSGLHDRPRDARAGHSSSLGVHGLSRTRYAAGRRATGRSTTSRHGRRATATARALVPRPRTAAARCWIVALIGVLVSAAAVSIWVADSVSEADRGPDLRRAPDRAGQPAPPHEGQRAGRAAPARARHRPHDAATCRGQGDEFAALGAPARARARLERAQRAPARGHAADRGLRPRRGVPASPRFGGDFHEFIQRADGLWGVLVGEVSGRGVPAALVGATRARTCAASSSAWARWPTPSTASTAGWRATCAAACS
jgi:hypothetical protein